MSGNQELVAARKAMRELNEMRFRTYSEILGRLSADILSGALAEIDRWEANGKCWGGYISGWRRILNSKDPAKELASIDPGMINGFLQNSPLAKYMDKNALERYWSSLNSHSSRTPM